MGRPINPKKDFKHSHEQRMWEHAVESHARAVKVLRILQNRTRPDAENRSNYWLESLRATEERFPALRNRTL